MRMDGRVLLVPGKIMKVRQAREDSSGQCGSFHERHQYLYGCGTQNRFGPRKSGADTGCVAKDVADEESLKAS